MRVRENCRLLIGEGKSITKKKKNALFSNLTNEGKEKRELD